LDFCEAITGRMPQKLLIFATLLHGLPYSRSREPPSNAHCEHSKY